MSDSKNAFDAQRTVQQRQVTFYFRDRGLRDILYMQKQLGLLIVWHSGAAGAIYDIASGCNISPTGVSSSTVT